MGPNTLVNAVVGGIYRDYSRQYGSLMMTKKDYLSLGGSKLMTQFSLWLNDKSEVEVMKKFLENQVLFSNYNYPVNIGNPSEITINEFAKEIIQLTQTNQKIIYQPLPKNDPLKRRPDISLANEILDWQPKVNREKGLKLTYDYFCSLTKEQLHKKEHQSFNEFNKF